MTAGLAFPPTDPEQQAQIRQELAREGEELGSEALHRRLAQVDPQAAGRIPPANVRRVIRALEVFELTGQPMSALQRVDADSAAKYNPVYLALSRPRADLYTAIERRVDTMLAAGWLEEVRGLLARGYQPGLQSLQAIGYRHLVEWLLETRARERPPGRDADDNGRCGLEAALAGAAVEAIKRDTRRYAKRQVTWFRREPVDEWLEWSNRSAFEALVSRLCKTAGQLRGAVGLTPGGA